MEKRVPRSGDNVQIRGGHAVTYDVESEDAVRVLHRSSAVPIADPVPEQVGALSPS